MTTISFNVKAASIAELVQFYNEHTTDKPVKKFADRKVAEKRVTNLLAWLNSGFAKTAVTAATPETKEPEMTAPFHTTAESVLEREADAPQVDAELPKTEEVAGTTDEAKDIRRAVAHPAMKDTLKLDRTIRCVETGETWKNAYQMWKAKADWMTSSQVDRLTGSLYSAAKQGERASVKIGERTFELVNVQALVTEAEAATA